MLTEIKELKNSDQWKSTVAKYSNVKKKKKKTKNTICLYMVVWCVRPQDMSVQFVLN